jgi:U3 small nucleolar RNA-associated protein 20
MSDEVLWGDKKVSVVCVEGKPEYLFGRRFLCCGRSYFHRLSVLRPKQQRHQAPTKKLFCVTSHTPLFLHFLSILASTNSTKHTSLRDRTFYQQPTMENHRIKSLSLDPNSRNRFRYATQRQREQRATADVYRGYKRRIGVTSSANREEALHHISPSSSSQAKKAKIDTNDEDITTTTTSSVAELSDLQSASLAEELDLAFDRNPSEIFGKFYRQIWYHVRSLPEIIHHQESIVTLMLEYLLTPTDGESVEEGRIRYGPNPATTDILHLLAVLARDLRHEIHPYLHTKILPRLVNDLLNPPMQKKQTVPLDVSVIEACLRTMAYCFRYDAEMLVSETTKEGDQPCLELMRQYYGKTLAHRREVVRRLSAEIFAPLIRRLPSEAARKRHLKRIFKAMATVASDNEALQRAQNDAIDGIAKLCTMVVQGVGGRLHSKAASLIRTILDCCCTKQTKGAAADALLDVGQRFLNTLCGFLKESVASTVYEQVITLLMKAAKEQSNNVSLHNTLQLSIILAAHADGELVRHCDNNSDVLATLELLLSSSVFRTLSVESQEKAFEFFCHIWRAKHADRNMGNALSKILSGSIVNMIQSDPTGTKFFTMFTKHILPVLPRELLMKRLGSLLLKAAAGLGNREFLFGLIHSLASVENTGGEDDEDIMETDSVFFYENALECDVNDDVVQTLLELAVIDIGVDGMQSLDLHLLAASIQCSVFTGMLCCGKAGSKTILIGTYKRIAAWLQSIITRFQNATELGSSDNSVRSLCVSLSIYALSTYSATLRKLVDPWTPDLRESFISVRESVVRHLKANPTSLWTVKSVAHYSSELKAASKILIFDDSDSAFDMLVPNLSRSNHFLRLHSLKILSTLPAKLFISNHADLDLSDDLDEEPSEFLMGEKTNDAPGLSGTCHLLDTLVRIEETPAIFQNERKIVTLLSTVEVQGRSGKLPAQYVEAAICHMMGLLSIRFSPICPAIQSAIVSLIRGCDDYAWCHLRDTVSTLMFNYNPAENKPTIEIETFQRSSLLRGYLLWEQSGGLDVSLFRQRIKNAEDQGRVSRHLVWGKEDVILSLWGVLEKQAQLIVTHSRDVVPIILRFLALFFRTNDPDAIEINFKSHLPDSDIR